MALFKRRLPTTVGALRVTDCNMDEIAEFISVSSKVKFTSDELSPVICVGIWVIKDCRGRIDFMDNASFIDTYELMSQGEDEDIADDYR